MHDGAESDEVVANDKANIQDTRGYRSSYEAIGLKVKQAHIDFPQYPQTYTTHRRHKALLRL